MNSYAGPCGTVWNEQREIYHGSDIILSQWAHDELDRSIARADAADPVHRMKTGQQKILRFHGDIVHVVRPGWQVYGHLLLDILPALWLYKRLRREGMLSASNEKILLPIGLPPWAWNIMQFLCDIKQEDCLLYNEPDEVVLPNRLYLPSNLRIDNTFSPLMNTMIEEIVAKCDQIENGGGTSNTPKRIFVYRGSRYSFVQRSIVNEDELVDIAKTYNVTPIDPVELAWTDQVRLFAHADLVIGAFGSGMHNTIFSKPSTRSLILTNSRMNWIQSGISALRQQRMGYVWPSQEDNEAGGASMVYDPDTFKQALAHLV